MPRPVFDEGDLRSIRAAVGFRVEFVEQAAQVGHEFQIGFLVQTTDVVHLSTAPGLEYPTEGTAMVSYIQPVAHVLAVAVHGQGVACQGVVYDQRNELFRKLVRAVIVRAVGRYRREPVGGNVCVHQVIRGSFAGAIRTVRPIAVRFGKRRGVRRERTVHLVGGNVEEAKARPLTLRKTVPIVAGRLQ